ncbi:MAG: succinyl-diaminopimelate desuccinylase [Roseiarcus sp.]|jgi:succinyl-diaminopimelate desuccinylase
MSAQPKSALDIARALIAFPSVTPADAGALPYLEGLLEEAGFAAETVSFAAPGTPSIDNLYARFGVEAPNFVFAGHTDVVPPGDVEKWRFDPFAGALADGQIWGRGACDMKGGLAAALAAALRFVARGPFRGSISFLVTGDEEGPAVNGTVKLLDWARERGERFDHCLLGEPTSVAALGDMIKNGRRGSLTGRLVVSGKQGHVAYPRLADNPIRPLAPILTALQTPPLDQGTPDFEASNLEVVSVDVGNPATNVIPGEVRLVFNIRFNDLWTPESLSAEIERRVAAAAGGARVALSFDPTNAVAFLTQRGAFTDLVARAVEETTGRRPKLSTSGGTSDARFIKDACPVVEIGLVGATMHGVDERAPLDDLETLSRLYERVLELYFSAFGAA